nr:tRNA threonylcarbamoyladenosine dehydratase [uncultured Oscillibacter sp.]
MLDQFSRTELLLGREGMERLARAHVAVFGLGGVGGYTAEALVRSGVGALDLIDSDRVSLTNLNRQILATHRTLGQYKADAARERALEINPDAVVNARKVFYGPGAAGEFDFSCYDYVVDAIDTVTGKLALIQQALEAGTSVISCMGAGNKLDPAAFRVADIYETSVCPLARVMRKELKRRGVKQLKVVYSQEPPRGPEGALYQESLAGEVRRQVPGSAAFVPAAAGLILAGEVVRDLALNQKRQKTAGAGTG